MRSSLEDSPNWFPDGSKIVCQMRDGEVYDLWMMNADGSEITKLTDDPHIDLYPDVWVR